MIKLFLTDVDGTLTDGGMYYTAEGDVMKCFYVRDGMGMQLLQKAGVKVGIITSENTPIVEKRARKLGVDFLYQGVGFNRKVEAVEDLCQQLGISMSEVAYIGDDVNDIALLSVVGLAACPQDAEDQVKTVEGIMVTHKQGGKGAVREFAKYILKSVC